MVKMYKFNLKKYTIIYYLLFSDTFTGVWIFCPYTTTSANCAEPVIIMLNILFSLTLFKTWVVFFLHSALCCMTVKIYLVVAFLFLII